MPSNLVETLAIEEATLQIIHEVLRVRALHRLADAAPHRLLDELADGFAIRQRLLEEDQKLGLTEQKECV